jgi:hypothetical protein
MQSPPPCETKPSRLTRLRPKVLTTTLSIQCGGVRGRERVGEDVMARRVGMLVPRSAISQA